ncbi:MAG TPA: Maf family protein [Solirubrobacteraceae bacterium]|nr:Maf family protein [Solirubrobacteraceae bacterium]
MSRAVGAQPVTHRLVLASASPQRRAILIQIGVSFDVEVSAVQELTEGPPEEVVLENAYRKARAVADRLGGQRPVLGVDTIVALGRQIFHKPPDAAAARATLAALAGREHSVLSGMCLIEGDRSRTAAARTRVRFRALTDEQIQGYVETGEWRGRAGGYAIQERGALLVSAIEGDYLNVVGLPVATLAELAPWLL